LGFLEIHLFNDIKGIRKKGCFPLINGDNWFTNTMLTNSLSRSEKLQSQMWTTTSDFGNLFAAVLNQLMIQQDLQSTVSPTLNSPAPNMDMGNMFLPPPVVPNMIPENMSFNKEGTLRFQSINSEKINQVLDGKLKGMGDVFVRAGQHYNIDSSLLAAIAQHETGNGKSHAAIEKNNVAGMMGSKGLKSYSSIEESIMDMARNLSKNYIGEGLSSISKIAGKYAPIGAGNDPNGLNNHWVTGVTKYFDQLKV
jgi:hypothetical protein